MTEPPTTTAPVPSTIRSDLVDVAVEFLRNPKIIPNSMESKREFLRKKGLTDSEINYAFQLGPPQQVTDNEPKVPVVVIQPPSFLRRLLTDLALAGFLSAAFVFIKRWLQSKQAGKKTELNKTLQSLQLSIREIQATLVKLEQTVDQLHLTMQTLRNPSGSVSSIDEIKTEIQSLKGLLLSRSQFPTTPQVPRLPSWQLEIAEKNKARNNNNNNNTIEVPETETDSKEDGDGIVVISEQDKKSDDENPLSISSSTSSSEVSS